MQELDLLNRKLDALLRRYAALKQENEQLRQTVRQQTHSIESLNLRLQELEAQLGAVQVGNAIHDPEERQAVRKQLDSVIAEIDKILTSLND